MKKEVIIAVIAGLVLGLVITMGIYTANRSLNAQRAKKLQQNSPGPSPTPVANAKSVSITSWQNFDLTDSADANIAGIAWPGAVVALLTDTGSQMLQADSEGIFSFNIRLIKGFNELSLIASSETTPAVVQNLVLTYSTNKIELPATGFIRPAFAAEDDASAGAGTVTDKIKERLQDTVEDGLTTIKETITEKSTAPRKKAYIGQVGAMDQNSLTLTYKDQEFTVTTDNDTAYVKGASTALNRQDLNPDDFVISMGFFFPQTEEFRALRVSLIAAPQPPANRQLVTGKITEVDGQKISLNNKTLPLTKNTDLIVVGLTEPETADLALGDNLFAIVTLDINGDIDSVDNVLVIPGKNNPAGLTPTNQPAATGSSQASPSPENAE